MRTVHLSRAVALTVAAAVAAVARLEGFPLAIAVLLWLVAAWRAAAPAKGRALLSRRWRLPVGALVTVAGVVMLHELAGGAPAPLLSLLLLLVLVQLLLLLGPQTPFVSFLLLLLSNVHVAGAGFLRQDAPALLLTGLYVVLLTTALVLFERDAAGRRLERRRGAVRHVRLGAARSVPRYAVLRTVTTLTLVGFLGGMLLFLVVPRGIFPSAEDEDDAVDAASSDPVAEATVVSDLETFTSGPGNGVKGIRLGDVGKIKEDLTPYFEVELPPGRKPWLRENSYDLYGGGDWSASQGADVPPVSIHRPDRQGWIDLGREDDPVRGYTATLRVYRGPQRRLYLQRDAVRLRFIRRQRALANVLKRHPNEQIDSLLVLHSGDLIIERLVPPVTDPLALEAARSDATTAPGATVLTLPPECAPLADLARSVVGAETNPWRRARMLERWLKSEAFTYTLEMPVVDTTRPVVDFLLRRRSGHCEYYAASLTLLLRSLGHPARIVRGFRGGDYLADRGTWMVRGIHYHAWTEMHLDGLGWTSLDPTPPDREAVDADESVTRVSDILSGPEAERGLAARLLGYGADEHAALARALRDGLAYVVVRPARFLFGPQSWFAGFALTALGLVFLARRRRRTAVAKRVGVSRASMPTGAYGRALALLARRGVRRRPPQTAREFERGVARLVPDASAPLAELTRIYERERFGGLPPDREATQRAAERLETLREAVEARREEARRRP